MTEPLLTVPAKEVASKFGYYTDEAMLHPVGIQRHGVTRVVMLSLMEYERLRGRDRTVLRVRDLDDETLDAIRTAEPSERSRALGRPARAWQRRPILRHDSGRVVRADPVGDFDDGRSQPPAHTQAYGIAPTMSRGRDGAPPPQGVPLRSESRGGLQNSMTKEGLD